ncbi:TPA: hypothetical protein JLE25_005129 [Escherichia coli]|nr:hypothetical protein [Escherichia coli]
MSDRVRLLGRGWKESLIGAFEKPPAMPEDIYLFTDNELFVEPAGASLHSDRCFITAEELSG